MTITGNDLIALVTGGVLELAESTLPPVVSDYTGESPASIIAQYIVATLNYMSNPDDATDWPLFVSHLPFDIISCGCIYDTAGVQDGRISSSGEVIEHPGIQLTIRSKEYEMGREKAEQVALALDAVFNEIVSIDDIDYTVQNIKRMSDVISLGIEPGTQRNHLFTVNFLVTINKS